MKLYNLPKDLLVKLLTVVEKRKELEKEKEYGQYIVVTYEPFNHTVKTFDELHLKHYLGEKILQYMKRDDPMKIELGKLLDPRSGDQPSRIKTFFENVSVEELIKKVESLESLQIQIVKGKHIFRI